MKTLHSGHYVKIFYNSFSSNLAIQHTVATVLHADVVLILEGLRGELRHDHVAVASEDNITQ